MGKPSQDNPIESLTLKEIKKSYDQVLDIGKILDIKARYILAATGTTTTLLFVFFNFILIKFGVSNLALIYFDYHHHLICHFHCITT